MSGPLRGIKILGFTHFAQAPFALQLLGDMGADVINIERPGTGDFNRQFNASEKLGGEGPFFLAMNRNKRSMTLDLKKKESKEIVNRLIKQSDVVVSNYRAGVLDKLGIGFEDGRKINDRIIYCEALGYGSSGPYVDLPGQDLLAQSMSGYATMVGPKGPPSTGGIYVVDMYSSVLMVSGILAALINKQNGGKAQKVEVNLLSSGIHLQSQEFGYYLNTGVVPERPGGYTGHPMQEAPYGIYETKNGYLSLATNASDKIDWFSEAIGVPELPALMPDKPTMLRNRDTIYPVIAKALKKYTTEHWLELFRSQGIWCAKVNDYHDVEKDPQVIHNGIIQEIDHPKAGRIRVVKSPIEFSETPCEISRRPPLLGEHNEEILKELSYSADEIEQLRHKDIF